MSVIFFIVIHCRLTLKCAESKWGSMHGKGKWGQSECIHSIHSLEERVHLICKTSPGLYAVCMNISFLFNIYLNLSAVNEFIYANIVCIDSLHSFITCFVKPVIIVLHSCDYWNTFFLHWNESMLPESIHPFITCLFMSASSLLCVPFRWLTKEEMGA